jgi:hypothetical protein
MLRAYTLQRERAYRAVAQKWSLLTESIRHNTITVQNHHLGQSSCIPDDGLVLPKHVVNLHESVEKVAILQIICEVTLKIVLHIYNDQLIQQNAHIHYYEQNCKFCFKFTLLL